MVHSSLRRAAPWLARRSRHSRRGIGASCVGVAALGLALMVAPPLAGQDVSLNELERVYEARQQAHETALAARQAQIDRLVEAIEAITIARESGDDDASGEANRVALAASNEAQRLSRRVTETRELLEQAREAYFEALQERFAELDGQRVGASPAELERIDALQRDVLVELDELRGTVVVQPVSFTIPIELDPRDDRPEILSKIRLLERRLEEADSLMAVYDRQIEALESIVEDAQRRADFMRGVRIFGDDLPPTGGGTQNQPERETLILPQDTTATGEPLSPEEQLQSVRNFRMFAEAYREEVLRKLAEFRAAVRGRDDVLEPGWAP